MYKRNVLRTLKKVCLSTFRVRYSGSNTFVTRFFLKVWLKRNNNRHIEKCNTHDVYNNNIRELIMQLIMPLIFSCNGCDSEIVFREIITMLYKHRSRSSASVFINIIYEASPLEKAA